MITLPPRYILLPVEVLARVMDEDPPPRALFFSYVLLASLAWESDYRKTPLLQVRELIPFLHLHRRQYYEQIGEMESRTWLRSDTPRPGCVRFSFPRPSPAPGPETTTPENSAENRTTSAENRTETVVVLTDSLTRSRKIPLPEEEKQQPDSLSLRGGPGGSAKNRTFSKISAENRTDFSENASVIAALVERGVTTDAARQLATDYPAAQILAAADFYDWAREQNRASGPGWLVRAIKDDWEPPATYIPPDARCPECGESRDHHLHDCHTGWLESLVRLGACPKCYQFQCICEEKPDDLETDSLETPD
jgi:hypothetical protein